MTVSASLEDIATSLPARLNFSAAEFARRQQMVREAMAERGLGALLIYRLEDQYWLTGFDSVGGSVFHILYFGLEEITHLSRSADLANIAHTSLCRDVRLFDDAHENTRGGAIKDLLASHGMAGHRIGIELDGTGLPADLHRELQGTLAGWCELVDSSQLIRDLRRVKSPAELGYLRRAGQILGEASAAAIELTVPGAFEGDLMGEFQRVVARRDGETFAAFPLGSGPRALLVRPITDRGYVGTDDQVLFEPGAAYRHYCAATMFTVLTGPNIDPRHVAMHAACVDALHNVQELIRPGNTFGMLYEAHRRTFAAHGFEHAALKACGYSMGAVWQTTWMEPPMIAADAPLELKPGMAIFTHMILTDRATGLTMALGETVEVTDGAPARISEVPKEPIISMP